MSAGSTLEAKSEKLLSQGSREAAAGAQQAASFLGCSEVSVNCSPTCVRRIDTQQGIPAWWRVDYLQQIQQVAAPFRDAEVVQPQAAVTTAAASALALLEPHTLLSETARLVTDVRQCLPDRGVSLVCGLTRGATAACWRPLHSPPRPPTGAFVIWT